MKKRLSALLLILLFLALSFLLTEIENQEFEEEITVIQPIVTRDFGDQNELFTIGMWNLRVFGQKKASNETLLLEYADIISKHDIFIIQEIRNKDGTAFLELCDILRNYSYSCFNSSRAGSGSTKEQYGFFYNEEVSLVSVLDHNPRLSEIFERPPFEAKFQHKDLVVSIATIHVRPDSAETEIAHLDSLFEDRSNLVLIGDLNADCSYYTYGRHFQSWISVIGSDLDTTISNSDCAYDRILLTDDLESNYDNVYGITTEDVTYDLSDHYPVWVSLRS